MQEWEAVRRGALALRSRFLDFLFLFFLFISELGFGGSGRSELRLESRSVPRAKKARGPSAGVSIVDVFDVFGRFGPFEDLGNQLERLGLGANPMVKMVGGLGGLLASRGRQNLRQIPEEHLQLVGRGLVELVAEKIQEHVQRAHEGISLSFSLSFGLLRATITANG